MHTYTAQVLDCTADLVVEGELPVLVRLRERQHRVRLAGLDVLFLWVAYVFVFVCGGVVVWSVIGAVPCGATYARHTRPSTDTHTTTAVNSTSYRTCATSSSKALVLWS